MRVKVGVFPRESKRKPRFEAYTLWYTTAWTNCCEHEVEVANRKDAKKAAIAEHKALCLARLTGKEGE